MDTKCLTIFISLAAIILSSSHPSALGANINHPKGQATLEDNNLFTDLRDSEALSPQMTDQHPQATGRPSAPSPPKMASQVDASASFNMKTPTDDIPQHMKDFHSRVLEHIHATAESTNEDVPTVASPEYMLSLYRQKESDPKQRVQTPEVNYKQGNALKRSDIVRSFSAIDSYKQSNTWVLVYDLSAILRRERIRLSELSLQLKVQDRDITKIELVDEQVTSQGGVTTLERKQIGSIAFNAQRMPTSQKITIDTTRVIRRWYNEEKRGNQREDSTEEIESLTGERREISEAAPILFVFSSNKQLDLMETVASHQSRNRRSSASRQRKVQKNRGGKRKNKKNSKKRNKTNKSRKVNGNTDVNRVENTMYQYDMVSTNSLEFEAQKKQIHTKETDELLLWKKEQREVKIVSVKKTSSQQKEDSKSPVKPNPFGYSFRIPMIENVEPTHCRLVPFEVDFDKIGWGTWIVHPKRYNANRCAGHCNNPVVNGGKPTNHAFLQSIMSNQHGSNVPGPCCVPTKLEPISLLYLHEGEVKQQQHQDMIVTECGCR